MSFHPLGELFTKEQTEWRPEDVRHYIQHFLREQLKTDALYCDEFVNGVASVRVATPTVAHATHLLEYDLAQAVLADTKKELASLRVRLSS